jgi:hypothetical protein
MERALPQRSRRALAAPEALPDGRT